MKNIINTSQLQRKGLKEIYETIEEYGKAYITNQRQNKTLLILDNDSPYLLLNIIKGLKVIKKELKNKYHVKSVGITGSFARGENNLKSDLDLVIDYKINDMKEFVLLEEFIAKHLRIKNIDLLTKDGISPFAKENIERDAIYV